MNGCKRTRSAQWMGHCGSGFGAHWPDVSAPRWLCRDGVLARACFVAVAGASALPEGPHGQWLQVLTHDR